MRTTASLRRDWKGQTLIAVPDMPARQRQRLRAGKNSPLIALGRKLIILRCERSNRRL
jgi:hypothetical protein